MATISAAKLVAFALLFARVSAEDAQKDPILSYHSLSNPFRMQKLNLIWDKARLKLSEYKLKLLHYELKGQDKEEMALKRLKAESGDKDGLREAEVRARLSGILDHFGVGQRVDGGAEAKKATGRNHDGRVFKDKRLDRLWEKAQMTALDDEELLLLKQEFQHYQEKAEEYSRMVETSGKDPLDRPPRSSNVIDDDDDEDNNDLEGFRHVNSVVDEEQLKLELQRRYDHLHRSVANPSPKKQFDDPKVDGLWKLAQEAEFTAEELDGLRQEMKHYEHRLQKLRQMRAELQLMDERGHGAEDDEKTDVRKRMDLKLRKFADTVGSVHSDLERRIFSRHSEL